MNIVFAVQQAFRSVEIITEEPLKIATPPKAMAQLLAMGALPTKSTYKKGNSNWLIMEIPESIHEAIIELANTPTRSRSGGVKALARKGRDIFRFSEDNPAGENIGAIEPIDDIFSKVYVAMDGEHFSAEIERVDYGSAYPEGTATTKKYAYILVIEGNRKRDEKGQYLPRGGGFNSFASSLVNWLQGEDDAAEADALEEEGDDE